MICQIGCSQNHRPVLAISYIAALKIWGYQNGTLVVGATEIAPTVLVLKLKSLL